MLKERIGAVIGHWP